MDYAQRNRFKIIKGSQFEMGDFKSLNFVEIPKTESMDKIVNITLLGVFLTFVNPLIAQVSQVEIKESKTGYRLYKDVVPLH